MAVAGVAAAAAVAAVAGGVGSALAAGQAADALGTAKDYMAKFVSRSARYTDDIEMVMKKYGGRADKAYDDMVRSSVGQPSLADQRRGQAQTAELRGAMAPYGGASSTQFPYQAALLTQENTRYNERYDDAKKTAIYDLMAREEGRYSTLAGEAHKTELQGASEVAQLGSAQGVAHGQKSQAIAGAVGSGVSALVGGAAGAYGGGGAGGYAATGGGGLQGAGVSTGQIGAGGIGGGMDYSVGAGASLTPTASYSAPQANSSLFGGSNSMNYMQMMQLAQSLYGQQR